MESLSAETLTGRVKGQWSGALRELAVATGNRPLEVQAVEGLPSELVQSIDGHNAAVTDFCGLAVQLDSAADALVGVIEASDATADKILFAVDRVRGWRLPLLLNFRRLTLTRASLLQQIADALRRQQATAQSELEAAREEGHNRLVTAGAGIDHGILAAAIAQLPRVKELVELVAGLDVRVTAATQRAAAAVNDPDLISALIAGEVARLAGVQCTRAALPDFIKPYSPNRPDALATSRL